MSIYSPSTLSASAPALRSLALSNAANVILTTFTDAGGLTFALNWALYIARSGQRPTIGLDGPPPRQASAQWDQTNALAYKLPAAGGHAASNGLARWTLRWVGLARLLDLGINVLLSDTDVVWLRNPAPYFAAVLALHPLLDVALGTDHATYAEVFRDDVLYSSTEPPTRRALLARWQRVNSSRSATADVSEQMFSPSVLDFDLDPYPANGARDGTWNPGVLFARSTVGGRAFVQAELAELAAAGTNLGARGLKDAVEVSDQSEMCRLLQQLMLSDAGEGWTGLDHARHPLDTSLLQVPLELQPEAAAAAAQAATFGLDAADVTLPWACDGTLAMEPDSRRGWRRRGRGKRRGGGSGARAWWCQQKWATLRQQKGMQRVDASVSIGLLPVLQFGSYLATQVVREAALYGATPLAMHATHIVGKDIIFRRNNRISMGACTHPVWCLGYDTVTTAAAKAFTMRSSPRHRLWGIARGSHRLWALEDEPSYFTGRYLTYTNRPADRLRRFRTQATGNEQWRWHFALLQEQLQDLQAALATALTLNRTLVLPRMLCSCVFAQWPFVSQGNLNCQPMHMQGLFPRVYECPPSYWLSLPEVFRSDVPLREPGFLELAAAAPLRASRLTLHVCDPSPTEAAGEAGASAAPAAAAVEEGGEDGPAPSTAMLCTGRGVPLVRARAGQAELARALGPLHLARVLHLEQPRASFGGFEDTATANAFGRRAGRLLGAWCCVQSKKQKKPVGGATAANAAAMHEPTSVAALLDVDRTPEIGAALNGAAFRLRFRPRLGVVGGSARRTARTTRKLPPSWHVTELVNNVFGRAELRRDTACCKYLGQAASIQECTAAAEQHPTLSARVSSVTWHRGRGTEARSWAATCYAITDGTWQPVPVEQGQAEADSARRAGGRPLPPAAELTTSWVDE